MKCAVVFNPDAYQIAILAQDGDFVFQPLSEYPKDYSSFLGQLNAQIQTICAGHSSLHKVILSLPAFLQLSSGALDIKQIPFLNQHKLSSDLQASLNSEVVLFNHAQCLAQAIILQREYSHISNLFCLFLDDGVCGGLIIGRKLITGANKLAGNLAHTSLAWPVDFETEGRVCVCGRTGCLAHFITPSGLSYDYHMLCQINSTAQEIIKLAEKGDIVAESVLQAFEDRLARGLALIVNLIDPELIVLAGPLSIPERLYVNIPRKWPGYVDGKAAQTKLIRASFHNKTHAQYCLIGALQM